MDSVAKQWLICGYNGLTTITMFFLVLFVGKKHCLCLQGRLMFVEILVLKVVCVLYLQSNVRNGHSDCYSQMFWSIQYLEFCLLKDASLNRV